MLPRAARLLLSNNSSAALYQTILQSSFKSARVWATEVPVTAGKDVFKYSLSPGGPAVIEQW